MCPANITTNTELEATIPILSLVRAISVIKLLLFFWLWIKSFQNTDVKNKRNICILWYLSCNQWFIFTLNRISKMCGLFILLYYLCLLFQKIIQGCLQSNLYVFEFFYSFALKPQSIVFRLWCFVVLQHRIHIKWVPTVL